MTDLPTVRPSDPHDETDAAGVVLAAGTSSRFGERNKLLATVDGEPLVRRAVGTFAAASVDPVVVVLGHETDRMRAALPAGVETVTTAGEDQSASLRAGIEAVGNADAVVVGLGDMPAVSPATVDALVGAWAAGAGDALAAAHAGERGNPVLFDRRHFDALARVDGDVGGREVLLESDGAALVAADDPGVLRDVDRPADLPLRSPRR